MAAPLVLGVDVGTQGARVVVVDAKGEVIAQAAEAFAQVAIPGLPPGHIEQYPAMWWEAVAACLRAVIAQLRAAGRSAEEITAGAVDSTSGTVLLLDARNHPLRPAVMYSDRRAQEEAEVVNAASEAFGEKIGYRFNASFALPRLLWLARHEPHIWEKAARVVHAADYIVGRLTGVYDISDQSNALKTGFDLVDFRWPDFIECKLGLDCRRLPRVVKSGEEIAPVSAGCAAETGLSVRTRIVAGMTDGSADQVASGAYRLGDWNSVLGTTLVLKGLTPRILHDPQGRVYCHLHPMGYWMPGGASNVGARVLEERFPGADLAMLDRAALHLSPTPLILYPLTQRGERFPFNRPDAEGFVEGEASRPEELYAAYLEGIAFTERLAYEVVEALGAEVGGRVWTTGGGAKSAAWRQMRADILNREVARAENPSAAMGSAIVAASRTLYPDLCSATARMVRLESVLVPRPTLVPRYEAAYRRFLAALRSRGYIS